jgi:hypothetical protein
MSKKKLENMNTDERIAYWAKVRETERNARQVRLDNLTPEQLLAVHNMYKLSKDLVQEALYGAGVRYIYCDTFNELEDTIQVIRDQFNMGDTQ